MILIADSGSTKTDWRLIDDKGIAYSYSSIGLNPYFQSSEQISEEIGKNVVSKIDQPILSFNLDVYFYGSGCSHANMCEVVEKALRTNFPKSTVEVNHDLLGAARALCGNQEGIAAILGTGSNSCYYDGKEIVENIAALGYVLGDEGSGAHIGKTFIIAFLNGELPENISADFYNTYQLNKGNILETVYKKPLPNRFLASFSKYIYQHLNEKYIKELVTGCFIKFFDRHICKYTKHQQLNLNCVGSVAFYYRDILKEVAHKKGITIGKIIETPIEELVQYHLNK